MSSNDIKTEEITDIENLKKLILSDSKKHLYRGQSDSSWGLVPNIYRKEQVESIKKYITREPHRKIFHEDKVVNRRQLRNIEIGLVIDFLRHCHYISLRLPFGAMRVYEKYYYETSRPAVWPSDEELEILSIMQHYRFPTRLLDWSYNILVAAFFAAKHHVTGVKKNDYFSIWEFDQERFISIKRAINRGVRKAKSEDKIIRRKYTYFVDALNGFKIFKSDSEINKNLGAQKGCFTYILNQKTKYFGEMEEHRISHDEYMGLLISELENLKDFKNDTEKLIYTQVSKLKFILKKYKIDSKLAIDTVKFLEKLGYNQSALFPSYDSVLEQIELDVSIKYYNKR